MPLGLLFGNSSSVATVAGTQVTLAQIEQETAYRLGPYAQRTQSSTTHADAHTAFFDELSSEALTSGIEGMFMLRRGQKSDGTTISVAAADRQRVAGIPDPTTGGVPPDRPWAVPPADGELIEFHHLDPTLELRKAVQNGLRRCFFEDRASVTLTSAATERDVTASVFWITRPDQIRRYQFTTAGATATLVPTDVPWAMPFEKGGHVWLAAWPDQYPNTLLITALRPHSTWVNGIDSATGPTTDTDLLSVELSHAAAAAHIEAWKLFPAKLLQAAEGGYQASQQQAATEFTREATAKRRRRPTSWTLSASFGDVGLSSRIAR